MNKEIREHVDRVTKWRQFLNEDMSGGKTILNLIFTGNEISELYKIKDAVAINHLKDMDIDPFSNQNDDNLIDFIKTSFDNKGIKVDSDDMKNILNIVSNHVRI